jgi:hypothetical protein
MTPSKRKAARRRVRAKCDRIMGKMHCLIMIASTARLSPALRVEAAKTALEAQRLASRLASMVIALECDEVS